VCNGGTRIATHFVGLSSVSNVAVTHAGWGCKMEEESIQLEFVGGPFDGYVQAFMTATADLAKRVALPVNENVFLMLDGKSRGPAAPSTKHINRIEVKRRVILYQPSDWVTLGGLNEAAGAAVEGSRSTRFLSERIVGVKAQPFRQEVFRWLRSALFAAA